MALMPQYAHNIRKLDSDSVLTVKINVTKEFKLRFIVAQMLIHMAAKVLGCGIKIEDGDNASQ